MMYPILIVTSVNDNIPVQVIRTLMRSNVDTATEPVPCAEMVVAALAMVADKEVAASGAVPATESHTVAVTLVSAIVFKILNVIEVRVPTAGTMIDA